MCWWCVLTPHSSWHLKQEAVLRKECASTNRSHSETVLTNNTLAEIRRSVMKPIVSGWNILLIEQFATPTARDNGLDYGRETDLSTSVMTTIHTQSRNMQGSDATLHSPHQWSVCVCVWTRYTNPCVVSLRLQLSNLLLLLQKLLPANVHLLCQCSKLLE